jgi:ribosomal RNA-processing protein 8
MSKQSKKAAKKKKTDKKAKKKKQLKKLGLAKFIPNNKKPKQKKVPQTTDRGDQEQTSHPDGQKKSKQLVVNRRKKEKDLSLIERCKLQMSSSLLRLVDEKLYTNDTSNIALDKDEFLTYHKAYELASESWPTKPIDFIVKFIKKRLFTKKPANKYKFADIGCGKQPLLKMKLPPKTRVQSFDLVSTHKDIVAANMDHLPLEDESVHCAVYSLSLMARNLGTILLEAKRILKVKGSLLIVEVTSRFEGREKRFVGKMERLGFKKQSMTTLKPNAYFTFFHFSKLDNQMSYPPSFLNIELKPCVYKAR